MTKSIYSPLFQRTPTAIRIFSVQTHTATRITAAMFDLDFRDLRSGQNINMFAIRCNCHIRQYFMPLVDNNGLVNRGLGHIE